MKFAKAMMISLALASTSALADDIRLGVPGYAGTGCPAGSASATLSPDAKQLSILFDSYVAEAGGSTRKTLDRKSCNIAIPVHVPQGMSVSIVSIDYRGFVGLPASSSATFNVEYFFANSRGPTYTRNFNGPSETDYLLNNTLALGAVVWSPCGADVNLRTNSSILVRSSNRRDNALMTVDSQDISAGLIYHLNWRSCR